MSAARRLLPVLLAAIVATGALAADDPDSVPKPERQVTCWNCHQVAIGQSGPLRTFVNLVPSSDAGAEPGQAFDLTVQAQNAWSAELRNARVTLDLANAASLGLTADVPKLEDTIQDAIPIDAATLAEPQRKPVPVVVPEGETTMTVRLRPTDGTGNDLALLVYPPGYPIDGEPYEVVDNRGQGSEDVFQVPDRATFNKLGYGNWTFVAQGRVVPFGDSGSALPGSSGTMPFELSVVASAEASDDRLLTLRTPSNIAKGGSSAVTFHLVALGQPVEGESLALWSEAWAHYDHADDRNDDNENATTTAVAFPVVSQGGKTTINVGEPIVIVPVPHNGPTMATVSEAVGYTTAMLLVASVVTGGMFGKASRRGMNAMFGAAKRRVAFHNFLSYGILFAATVHTVLFIVEAAYDWTVGLIWGGLAVLALFGLGVTGALQIPLIRAWGYGGWRWTHYGLAVAAILFTVAHGALDGAHFTDVQRALGWDDPLRPADAR